MGTNVFDMIKRIKENQALKNKNYFKSNTNSKATQKHLEDHVIASETDRKKIRDLAIAEDNRAARKAILLSIVCVVIGLILICLLFLLKF